MRVFLSQVFLWNEMTLRHFFTGVEMHFAHASFCVVKIPWNLKLILLQLSSAGVLKTASLFLNHQQAPWLCWSWAGGCSLQDCWFLLSMWCNVLLSTECTVQSSDDGFLWGSVASECKQGHFRFTRLFLMCWRMSFSKHLDDSSNPKELFCKQVWTT